jgi:ParB/RepB/Spo0J family partition protein
MSAGHFDTLRLGAIVPSRTNPRKHFNAERLAELAASIKASGVHTPVLVRPLPASRVQDTADMEPRPSFELVTGERRYRASIEAGQATIPAVIRTLTDDQVLEIQIIENLQRDDLQPLEEAEGYEALMHAHQPPLTADQIGERISKSRSYVYGRLKLLQLCQEGRQALQEGHITAAVAEHIARIPDTRVQAQALGNVFNPMTGDAMPVREARALIQRQYMLRLSAAPFPLDTNDFMPTEPACTHCSRRTGADPDLFAESHSTDLCMDLGCYKAKQSAHQHLQLEAARAAGATIIEGREAREIIPPTSDGRLDGYLRLDDKRDSPEKGQTLRQLIGPQMEAEGIQPTLLVDPASKDADTIAVIDTATATRLLARQVKADQEQQIKAKGAKASKEAKAAAEELQKRKDHEHYWNTWTWRLMERAWAKIDAMEPGMYSLPEQVIRMLARAHLPKGTDKARAERLCALLGLGKIAPAPALAEWVNEHPDPDRALALIMLFNAATTWQDVHASDYPPSHYAVAIAEDQGVDVKVADIQAEVEVEHTAEILARTKVQAETPAAAPAKGSTPHRPAAQAQGDGGGVKGKGKGKKASAAPVAPKTSEAEARTGIAAAMQGNEAGAEDGPGDADQAGGAAAGGQGEQGPTADPATGQQGVCICVGDEVIIDAPSDPEYHGKRGVVHLELPDGQFDVMVDGETIAYPFEVGELKLTGSRVAWPMPRAKGMAA